MRLQILSIVAFVILFADADASPKFRSKRASNSERCGTPSQSTSLVINGNDFQRGNWPWMVALMLKTTTTPRLFCGGVLVSANKVLTGEVQALQAKEKKV